MPSQTNRCSKCYNVGLEMGRNYDKSRYFCTIDGNYVDGSGWCPLGYTGIETVKYAFDSRIGSWGIKK